MYDAAAKSLKILSAGITIGESKGKDIIPAQALALSRALNKKLLRRQNSTTHRP